MAGSGRFLTRERLLRRPSDRPASPRAGFHTQDTTDRLTAARARDRRLPRHRETFPARDGARVGDIAGTADASLSGTANELVLAFYGRKPVEELKLEGDAKVFARLISWEPS
nr:hypothetical protein [Lentzea waywayandensis]